MFERRLLRTHVVLPALAFLAIATVFALTDLDLGIAHAWAFDSALGGFPARNAWWANALLHTTGKYTVWCFGLAAIAIWIASFRLPRWREYRRPALHS